MIFQRIGGVEHAEPSGRDVDDAGIGCLAGTADRWVVLPVLSTASPFQSGALVNARRREWVVLPESTAELLMLCPVGGLDEEVTGVLPAVEPIESATFRLSGREDLGDVGRAPRRALPPSPHPP